MINLLDEINMLIWNEMKALGSKVLFIRQLFGVPPLNNLLGIFYSQKKKKSRIRSCECATKGDSEMLRWKIILFICLIYLISLYVQQDLCV